MDKNYYELVEALKSHSERIENFISTLNALKHQKPGLISLAVRKGFSSLKEIFLGDRSSKPDLLQKEELLNADSPQSCQNVEVKTVLELIKDVKEDMKTVERRTDQCVKMLSQFYRSATTEKEEKNEKKETDQDVEMISQDSTSTTSMEKQENEGKVTEQDAEMISQDNRSTSITSSKKQGDGEKETEPDVEMISQDNTSPTSGKEQENVKEEKPQSPDDISAITNKEQVELSVVQVYERDGNTSDFVTAFKEKVDKRYKPNVVVDVSKIDVKKPLLILCQTRTRLQQDIDYALEQLKGTEKKNFTRLGIIFIHTKEEHALPTTSSDCKLGGDEQFKDMWLIDTAFSKESKFYDCNMNKEAILKVQKFLKVETSV